MSSSSSTINTERFMARVIAAGASGRVDSAIIADLQENVSLLRWDSRGDLLGNGKPRVKFPCSQTPRSGTRDIFVRLLFFALLDSVSNG
jgi:hypothetical protein